MNTKIYFNRSINLYFFGIASFQFLLSVFDFDTIFSSAVHTKLRQIFIFTAFAGTDLS